MKPAGRGGGAGGRRERNNQGGKGRSRTVDGLVKSAGGLVDRLRHPFGSRGQERVGSSTELSPFGDEEVDLLPFELGAMLVRDRCVFVSASLRLCVGMRVCVCVCMYVVPVHVCACFRKRGPHRISTLHISVGASAGPSSSIRHARRHPDTWTQTDVLAHVGNRDRKWRRNCAGALGRQAATLSLCLTHEAFGEVESWLIHRELAMPSMPCSLCACTVRRHKFLETYMR